MSTRFDPRRRALTLGLTAAVAAPWAGLSLASTGRSDGRRFILVVLRGGMDGLGAVPALGDPDFANARGALADFGTAALPLDATFALHPALPQLHQLWARQELSVIHATGLSYRERSHFDGQQVLESGGTRPYELGTGWLGRALTASGGRGLALETAVPLVLRGREGVDTWAPSSLPQPGLDLVSRLESLYAGDAMLAPALARARGLRDEAGAMASMRMNAGGGQAAVSALARKAADFIALPNGPQAAVLSLGGWDTHTNQAPANGALTNALRNLNALVQGLTEGLNASAGVWERTVVVVATEFGREVAMNGTLGTDHGSGGAAFVFGGAVQGGRVIADWPGLAAAQRFQGRDLRVTTDLRALFKGVLHDHLQIARATLDDSVFPGSKGMQLGGLLRG